MEFVRGRHVGKTRSNGQTRGKEVWTRSWKNIVQNILTILWWRHYDVTMMYGNNDVIIAIRSAFSNIFLFIYLKVCHKYELGRLNQVRIIKFSYWSANQKQDLISDWLCNKVLKKRKQYALTCAQQYRTNFELHNECESSDISHQKESGQLTHFP